jgi:Spy/CpxP family protein refolding chaperone
MKKIKLTIAAVLIASSTMWAQGTTEKKENSCNHQHMGLKDYSDKKCDKSKSSSYSSWMGELNLSDEQKKLAKELKSQKASKMDATKQKYASTLEKMKADFKSAKEKSGSERLSDEVKSEIKGKYHSELKPMYSEMKEIKEDFKNSLSAILTPEQKAKMKDMKMDSPYKGKYYNNVK